MKIKCEYCDSMYEDTLDHCPNCAAANPNRKEDGHQPRTIEELKAWYAARNLPPYETTRFFIGIDYKQPRAFGIYKDGNNFVVYKNKDDGSRAIRYRGEDEPYAVNEIYMKLKEEVLKQKLHQPKRPQVSYNTSSGKRRNRNAFKTYILIILVIMIISGVSSRCSNQNNGYYNYAGNTYYNYQNNWFLWNALDNEWYETTPSSELTDNLGDYLSSETYDSSLDVDNWNNSDWYDEYHSSSNDSDYDWSSSDSWDSGGTDWDSDW